MKFNNSEEDVDIEEDDEGAEDFMVLDSENRNSADSIRERYMSDSSIDRSQ